MPELESYYCPHWGQPAIPPLLMFKLEFLRYFCRLSDREVVARAQTDVLFRWFLQIPVQRKLPDASLLTRFRGRNGVDLRFIWGFVGLGFGGGLDAFGTTGSWGGEFSILRIAAFYRSRLVAAVMVAD